MVSPREAVHRIVAGNERFRQGKRMSSIREWNPELAEKAQRPFAIVLGCSDSRTPVEILFDQGFGDLFVVRVAGNIVAPSIVGSIEFAASQFGSRLVVVMGHSRCGAIAATVEAIQRGQGHESKNIRAITDRIAPHIEHIVRQLQTNDLQRQAMRANLKASVDHLRHASQILEDLWTSGQLSIVGAEYELESGRVLFDDVEISRLPSE